MAYRHCMALVEVRDSQGDTAVGAAFHIGDGFYVTARHVADNEITSFIPIGPFGQPDLRDRPRVNRVLLADDEVDLALLDTGYQPRLPSYAPGRDRHHESEIPIGGHLDDWLDEGMTLFEVILMGFPPVPQARSPVLIATAGHINAVVDTYAGPHPHFIVSAIPRGGYSGGPVIYQDFLIGVVTDSLVEDGAPAELGYAAAISVEPLWNLLHANGIYPGSNADFLSAIYDHDKNAERRLLSRQVRFSRSLRMRASRYLLLLRRRDR